MRRLILGALLLFASAVPAQALSTNDILSLVSMPLAVAAISDLTGVPQDQLADVAATLNNANVPPAEFVQVVRYVPVALADQQPQEQTFSQWLDTQTSQGVTGSALVSTIDDRLATTYNVQPVVQPDQVVYVDDNYIPQTVITRLQPVNVDPVTLAVMPLAVAAVSNLSGIPQDQLADLVATLNQANVPPAQFVQVVQYAPVALSAPPQPQQPTFVDFVQTQAQQGITGPALVTVIDQRLPSYGVPLRTTRRTAPVVISDAQDFPPVVQERVRAMAENNPHGGPPGQLKKQLGLQTGAEVVHGRKPGRQFAQRQVVAVPPPQPQRVVVQREEHGHGHGRGGEHGNKHEERFQPLPPMTSAAPPVPVPVQAPVVRPMPGPPGGMPPGQAKKEGGGDGGEGHGHGKGHGKD